jgi:colanic acid biosynthesis glycosyl transferase WcaI
VKLAILCPHFTPDVAPTGEVMTSIAGELVERGHRLQVITSLPWYEHHRLEPGWEGSLVRTEQRDWGSIVRVHPFPTDKTNIPARALAFGGFTLLVTAAAGLSSFRPDAVLSMSPPLTLGLGGWLTARRHRVPFVFNIQDVFPDVAIELGVLTDRRVIAATQWLERFTYERADAVTVLSEDLRDNLAAKVAARHRSKIRVIPNFVDTDWIRPRPEENSYRVEFGLTGKRVVMYAGNVGFSQSLDMVLDAAAALAHDEDVHYVINGGGAARPGLEQRARGLPNVTFVDMQPKERLPEVLAAADVHLVPLKGGLAKSSVPSKLYSILAAGRPVLASVDPGTEVARTLEREGAGVATPPDDAEAFTKALSRLLEDEPGRAAMGASGRRFVETWASPAAVAEAYERLFDEVRGRPV